MVSVEEVVAAIGTINERLREMHYHPKPTDTHQERIELEGQKTQLVEQLKTLLRKDTNHGDNVG